MDTQTLPREQPYTFKTESGYEITKYAPHALLWLMKHRGHSQEHPGYYNEVVLYFAPWTKQEKAIYDALHPQVDVLRAEVVCAHCNSTLQSYSQLVVNGKVLQDDHGLFVRGDEQ